MKADVPTARVSIGNTVRRLRWNRELTTRKLGELANIHPGRVWAIENGYAAVGIAELARIAEALDVSPMHFFEPENLPGDPDKDGAWVCLRRR